MANLQALGGTLFIDEVRARFDIVAFDPRDVGLSDPVTGSRTSSPRTSFSPGWTPSRWEPARKYKR